MDTSQLVVPYRCKKKCFKTRGWIKIKLELCKFSKTLISGHSWWARWMPGRFNSQCTTMKVAPSNYDIIQFRRQCVLCQWYGESNYHITILACGMQLIWGCVIASQVITFRFQQVIWNDWQKVILTSGTRGDRGLRIQNQCHIYNKIQERS